VDRAPPPVGRPSGRLSSVRRKQSQVADDTDMVRRKVEKTYRPLNKETKDGGITNLTN